MTLQGAAGSTEMSQREWTIPSSRPSSAAEERRAQPDAAQGEIALHHGVHCSWCSTA